MQFKPHSLIQLMVSRSFAELKSTQIPCLDLPLEQEAIMANYQPPAKNQIRLENMQTIVQPVPSLFPIDQQDTSDASLFLKYKEGKALPNAPFKLVELHHVSTSADEDSSPTDNKHKIRGPYRKYTCQEKHEAVQCIQNGQDVNVVSKRYGIPRRNLLRWKKFGCERKEGGGRPTDEEMERIIYLKIKQGELTDEKQIRELAISLSKMGSFKASKGWFVKFCQRFDIKLAGTPTSSQGMPQGDLQSTDSLFN